MSRPAELPHPARFLALDIPFGAATGFINVTLAYQLAQRGVSAGAIGDLIAVTYLPQTWKVFWAPVVDTTLTSRRWYVIGVVLTALFGMALAGVCADAATIPMSLLAALLLAGSATSTLLTMAVERLMAASVPDELRGRVAGWYQAGNLGGQGVGGGLALWVVQDLHWSTGASGALLAALCVACALALRRLPDPVVAGTRHPNLAAHAREIGRDLWALVRSRAGALALLICFLPIGSGAASNLWAAVAGDWHAGPDIVAFVNGAVAGLVSAAGCLAGGWCCDRMPRRTAYWCAGALQIANAVAMAFSPRTPTQFILWTTVYAFVTGLTYAAFTAVVLEAIGRSAGATKYSLLASLSNMPIAWMTVVDGHANDRWGTRGMLLAEATIASAAIVLFIAVARLTERRRLASV